MSLLLFNTTFSVSDREYGWWVNWMSQSYLPALQQAAPDASHELFVVDGVQQDGARAFSSQWRTASIASLGAIRQLSSRLCQQMMHDKGEACLAFSALMKQVDL